MQYVGTNVRAFSRKTEIAKIKNGEFIDILIRSSFLIGVVIIFLWPRYLYFGLAGKGISGYTFCTILLFLLLSFLIFTSKFYKSKIYVSFRYSKSFFILFFLFYLWKIISDLIGDTPADSISLTLMNFLYLGSWLIIASSFLHDEVLRKYFPIVIMLSGIVIAIIGAYERLTGIPVSGFISWLSIADSNTLGNIDETRFRNDIFRVKSIFSHPIVFGQVMASMSPIAFHFLINGNLKYKIISATLLLSVMISIYISTARSAIIVFLSSVLIYIIVLVIANKGRSKYIIANILFFIVIIVSPYALSKIVAVSQGSTSDDVVSSSARATQMEKGVSALEQSLVFGFGDGNAKYYAGIEGHAGVITVDNYYLTIAVNFGLVGIVLFISLLISIIYNTICKIEIYKKCNNIGINAAFLGAMTGLFVGLTILSIEDTLSIIFLYAGFLLSSANREKSVKMVTVGYRYTCG